jgi:hypothetical protein
MPSIDRDERFILSAAREMENFLFSALLYWDVAISAAPGKPGEIQRLSIGNLILAKTRLKAFPDVVAKPEVQNAIVLIENLYLSWRANWARKAMKEFPERLHLWKTYLYDVGDGFETGTVDFRFYQQQVRLRVMLELLKDESQDIAAKDVDQLSSLDALLNAHNHPGAFIWEKEIEHAFPRDRYSFLFVFPKRK